MTLRFDWPLMWCSTAEKMLGEAFSAQLNLRIDVKRAEQELAQRTRDLLEVEAQLAAKAVQIEEMRRSKQVAYDERNQMVAALSKVWPSHLAPHTDDDAPWEQDWRTIVCIHSPAGQLTWHIHDTQRPLFTHLACGMNHWDGHTTEEKYQRMRSLMVADAMAEV